ncbi:hypothetical protein [Stenotrophomonas sp. ZAC14D2_NAIMI4_6]|uniref:hypothetical protein n=1 Tax=Stenotrophomonas sp. ZAC14D2_NAIMI4_6 TaxID=2072406 RepID=UPI001901D82D|nr:hypothetical protein [Stenotrophomonas sp. ZAC14D2_NAIMI4_6]
MIQTLYQQYADARAAETLIEQCRAQVVRWRWASGDMAHDAPFMAEKYGVRRSRWLDDAKADPDAHVHHGFDAQERIVLAVADNGARTTVWLHGTEQRHSLSFYRGGRIASARAWHEHRGRLQRSELTVGHRGHDSIYHWDGEVLLRVVVRNWGDERPSWWCQDVYSYDEAGALDRIELQYLHEDGTPTGSQRLQYQRPRRGETLAAAAADVERRLMQAIATQLPLIPRDEPLYCLLLCFTDGDFSSAWPPFITWGRQSYRQAVLERGEDVAYYLWAPDEMRAGQRDDDECWFDDPALLDACKRHGRLMEMRGSTTSAMRLLTRVAAWLDAPEQRAHLHTTEDFVVAVADNTGAVDPLPAMRKAIGAQRWARLKAAGYV